MSELGDQSPLDEAHIHAREAEAERDKDGD